MKKVVLGEKCDEVRVLSVRVGVLLSVDDDQQKKEKQSVEQDLTHHAFHLIIHVGLVFVVVVVVVVAVSYTHLTLPTNREV